MKSNIQTNFSTTNASNRYLFRKIEQGINPCFYSRNICGHKVFFSNGTLSMSFCLHNYVIRNVSVSLPAIIHWFPNLISPALATPSHLLSSCHHFLSTSSSFNHKNWDIVFSPVNIPHFYQNPIFRHFQTFVVSWPLHR